MNEKKFHAGYLQPVKQIQNPVHYGVSWQIKVALSKIIKNSLGRVMNEWFKKVQCALEADQYQFANCIDWKSIFIIAIGASAMSEISQVQNLNKQKTKCNIKVCRACSMSPYWTQIQAEYEKVRFY